MTDQERKIKKYIRAVKRRLELPKELRERVVRDFVSSIAARREAGKTYEELVAELGSPKKAAAEFNEQMKEFIRPKSPWRYFFAALTALGAIQLLPGLVGRCLLPFLKVGEVISGGASCLGIIGGTDGPTAVYVTVPQPFRECLSLALLAVGIVGLLVLSWRRKRK